MRQGVSGERKFDVGTSMRDIKLASTADSSRLCWCIGSCLARFSVACCADYVIIVVLLMKGVGSKP